MPKNASEMISGKYRELINQKYPHLTNSWPILSGFNIINGKFNQYIIVIFKDTNNRGMVASSVAEFNYQNLGVNEINENNIERVRIKLINDYHLQPRDSIVILKIDGSNFESELHKLLQRHEVVMGVVGIKIFLSHKGVDKEMVRNFKSTLEIVGFDPWLDEDAMHAGVSLERGIRGGFTDSCAAIFFITPNFKDEAFLATEVDYAISEKRKKGSQFSIITLVLEDDGEKGTVPDLLQQYVWKEPKNELEALREIIKAVPLQLGEPFFRV
ncbi:toll/interleukin-1 receptor domain-containing protein [Anaerobacillus sp. 1_MG-2023]|uniref:toll/interleukin-1 receptor domain-containing protein n=1 Tax=Anaerobacillus sp. 1_MG-2023 TaxID=3062655 RepID=UPI0026E232B6|nr:toll/interleukin-1 receptor domain-containing protein [Anaerobacillus sp. 1_MG-2023]MDO6655929.1 toll/interleukin-1 receptor domain-containing protein [Anaerobacillus sp. 1_MG-2023]